MKRLAILALSLVVAASIGGCRKKAENGAAPAPSVSAAPPTLPPLVFKEDTAGALLTWVDDQGDFHVAEKVADVPEGARAQVRVVVAGKGEGNGEAVYVADLRTKGTDGAYPVSPMRRADWDELGASKRKSRLEALAPSVSAAPIPVPPASAAADASKVSAIIYGASWCGPCHQAEKLLKSLGVQVTMKDIEKSDAAQQEMQEKLRRSHRQGGSIPIIDVMGTIFVGYSEGALRAAVERARGAGAAR